MQINPEIHQRIFDFRNKFSTFKLHFVLFRRKFSDQEMLKPKALTEVLAQATTGGVDSTLLLSKEGVLLAYSGFGESNACISAAIASSVWSTFEKQGADVFQDQEDRLKLILSECEHGRVAITKVASLLLCMITKESVPMGMLRAKMQAVADYLESPLSRLATI